MPADDPLLPVALEARPFSGLWFSSRDDEERFCEQYASRHFAPVDCPRHRFVLIVVLAFAWGRLRDDYLDFGRLSSGGVAGAATVAACLLMHRLWSALEVGARPRRRTKFIIATRLLLGSLPLAFLSTVWFRKPVTDSKSLLRFLLLNTGALGLLFHSFAHPLFARHHLLVQVPTVAYMALHVPHRACVEGIITADSGPYIVAVWRWLSAFCTGAAVATPTPPVYDCCRDIVVVMLLVYGLCLPSYVLWVAEYRARTRFNPASPQLTWSTALVHVMLFVTVLSCFWIVMHAPLLAEVEGTMQVDVSAFGGVPEGNEALGAGRQSSQHLNQMSSGGCTEGVSEIMEGRRGGVTDAAVGLLGA
ncbi:unnamed protein product [Ostreobium quekettii]|uniref:Uncharacterized protein n=1 Tax=Ostreobium quekettii TaxID=121088 RepID=A0A8S1J5K3_9CHLO|nr:unnamed protein product [Ostreobium quekettii]|eukprot:evm.model.scf_771.2 EVM.evm.TU.scf_771.2   scf_771:16453-17535(-)